jgi:hypothetical protein
MRSNVQAGVFAFLMTATLAAAGAPGTEYWIGKPGSGDYFRKNAADAIIAAIALKRSAGQFEGRIEAARQDYFSAPAARRERAGDEFAQLLLAKDLLFADILVRDGINPHSEAVLAVMAMRGGRPLDGGIRPTALPSFRTWVRSIRSGLGATSDEALLMPDQAAFEKALIASAGNFEAYRKERDLAETRIWRSAHPAQGEEAGRRPLVQPVATTLPPRFFAFNQRRSAAFENALEAAQRSGARSLRCRYGPSYDAAGMEAFGDYYFWKDRPPENIASLMALDTDSMRPIEDHALAKCPGTEAEARSAASVPPKTLVSAELRSQSEQALADERAAGKARYCTHWEASLRIMTRENTPQTRAKYNAQCVPLGYRSR